MTHSNPQRLHSVWWAPSIATFGWVQHPNSHPPEVAILGTDQKEYGPWKRELLLTHQDIMLVIRFLSTILSPHHLLLLFWEIQPLELPSFSLSLSCPWIIETNQNNIKPWSLIPHEKKTNRKHALVSSVMFSFTCSVQRKFTDWLTL